MGESIHKGHRRRCREEFRVRGLEGLPDHKVLELLLFYAIPRGDVNPLAHRLLDRFGSLSGVFSAPWEQLLAVPGVGENTAALLRLVTAVGGRCLQDRADLGQLFHSTWQFQELLRPYFYGARTEMAYLVCLDGKGKLIACRKLSDGAVHATQITPRVVMEQALACNASAVVLAHNHVSGIALPSREDIAVTRYLIRLLSQVNIRLVDHLVLADDDMVSIRESGCLKDMQEG